MIKKYMNSCISRTILCSIYYYSLSVQWNFSLPDTVRLGSLCCFIQDGIDLWLWSFILLEVLLYHLTTGFLLKCVPVLIFKSDTYRVTVLLE